MAHVIGIDLGTTNTVVAVVRNGQVQVIPNPDDPRGGALIPSVVCSDILDPELLLVGTAAKNAMMSAPDAAFSTKRLMGMMYFDEEDGPPEKFKADFDRFVKVRHALPYGLYPDPDGKDELVRVKVGGKFYKPDDIAAMILKKAKENAEAFLGGPVSGAVITTPAYFEIKQREATRRAAEQVGLEVLGLLDEPNAAALAAGHLPGVARAHWVLVYDLGGGTFDVSLLQVREKTFNVFEKEGDNWLGGDDFDNCLIDYIEQHIRGKARLKDGEVLDVRRRIIKPAAEEAKIALSTRETVTVTIPSCAVVRPRNEQISVSGLEITRVAKSADNEDRKKSFNVMISGYIEQTLERTNKVFERSLAVRGMVGQVLLIGGSTYIPAVRQAMMEQFPGKVRADEEVNPMLEVARGAAIWADSLVSSRLGAQPGPRHVIINTIERSLGVECADREKHSLYRIFLKKGTPIPKAVSEFERFEVSKPDELIIPVYAGEDPDPSQNSCQGTVHIAIDPPVDIGHPVYVKLRMTENGLIEVETKVDERPETKHTFKYSELPDSEKWKSELDESLVLCQHFLVQYGEYIDEAQHKDLTKLSKDGQKVAETEARIEGVSVTKRIRRRILYTEQVGNQLFQVDQLTGVTSLSSALRSQLKEMANQEKFLFQLARKEPTPENERNLQKCIAVCETMLAWGFRHIPPRKHHDGILVFPA